MKTAHQYLQQSIEILETRSTERDTDTERSMKKCVEAFNMLTSSNMSETEGWLFMLLLKISRSRGGCYKEDDYLDLIGYAALTAECAKKELSDE